MTTAHTAPATVPGRRRVPSRGTAVTVGAGLVIACAVAAVASLMIGSRSVPPAAVLDTGHPLHHIVEARYPRTVLAMLAGAALGLAGVAMQGLTRNPLADPGILGVNAGAAFAIVVGITWFSISNVHEYIWFALAGAAVTSVAVHLIAATGREGASPLKLVVAGAALSAALTSWTSATLMSQEKTLDVFRFWSVGSVGGRGFDDMWPGLPFLAVGAAMALMSAAALNALALGDDLARGLGRSTGRDRLLVGLTIVLLAGTATALVGPISFVGLVVPHALRMVVGSDYRVLLPLSALGAALLVTTADIVGRIVLPPSEVQVGIMTAVVGVPFFLFMIRRGRMRGL